MLWKTYAHTRTFCLRNFEICESVLHPYLNVSKYCVDDLSCTSKYSWIDIHDFCVRPWWRRRFLLCEYWIESKSFFAMSYRSTSWSLYSWYVDCSSVFFMTDVHQWSKVDFFLSLSLYVIRSYYQNFFSFGASVNNCHFVNFWNFSHSLTTVSFTSCIFIAWNMATNLYIKRKWFHEWNPFSAMRSFDRIGFKDFLVDRWVSTISLSVFQQLVGTLNCLQIRRHSRHRNL